LPPLYLSSICENNCLYCDFSSNGERLSYDEFLDEFNQLLDMGYQSIELVSSHDPELFFQCDRFDLNNQHYSIDGLVRYFELGKKRLEENGGGMLTSNIPPVDVKSLKKLKSVGLDCYLIWLETFDPLQYSRLHKQESPKANQAYRLDSFERAFEAGIEHFAGAFLKGLFDWRKDEAALYLLDKYLKKKTGRGFSIVGTPRLKGLFTKSEFVKPYLVSDEDYELNFALDRILFDGILWLQTRESPSFNFRLIERYGAGVILTLDCSTAPGGYNKPPKAKPQFPVYRQDLYEAIPKLENNGYRVKLVWDSETLFNMQRNIGKKV
jgi:2-iminoacetate synthase